jgi:hypothetical protein
MKTAHIIELIESTPLTNISASDLMRVRAHVDICESCKQAFEAATISSLLLKEQAAAPVEPSPFFQTRVLAALRERQAASEQWSWSRMWRAAGVLASSMVASVAAFAALTFVIPGTPTEDLSSAVNSYSAEEVILNQGSVAGYQTEDQASDAQVLKALYETEEEK